MTCHHVTMSREMCERLTAGNNTPRRVCPRGGLPFLARPRAKRGFHSRTLRRDCDLALLPRNPAGAAALPLAVLMELCMRCVRDKAPWTLQSIWS